MKKMLYAGVFASLGVNAYSVGVPPTAGKAMNVIFILADDYGWSDSTLYGTTKLYETPNLERLAARGLTFSHAYAASPWCSPTRASILTGQTPARTGITAPECHKPQVRLKPGFIPAQPGDKAIQCSTVTRLETNLPTLGKLIKAGGYATAHFGKWHLGPEPYSPLQHGFDVDLPHWPGAGPHKYMAPWKFPDFKANSPNENIEDRMAEEAVKWMQNQTRPFFMNYWSFSVHTPIEAKSDLVQKYRQKVDSASAQRSPTYAAMVQSLDDAVGTLLDAVDRLGIADQTVIIFTSDNGGNMYTPVDGTKPTSNRPLRGGKATIFEGGIRVPCVVVWPGLTKPGSRTEAMIQTTDFYPTILKGLGLPLPENHTIDGVDIASVLRGERFNRSPMFTYLPRQTGVPDWMPPAVAVHDGDWKLIRQFYQGENGEHTYLLYNIKTDVGETNNLASACPEQVKEMDRLIEEHLKGAGAVTPARNPDFDPSQYHPEKIGIEEK